MNTEKKKMFLAAVALLSGFHLALRATADAAADELAVPRSGQGK